MKEAYLRIEHCNAVAMIALWAIFPIALIILIHEPYIYQK